MSGCVGSQFADPPPAWLSSVAACGLLKGSAVRVELDSETSPHPASTKTNKEAASAPPNLTLFSHATMVAPSLMVTACVSYGKGRTAPRGTALTERPGSQASMACDLSCPSCRTVG